MAFADSGTHCLGWLLASTVFYYHVLVWGGPSLLLIASRLEDALVSEDEMAAFIEDLADLIPKLDGHEGILLI